ncbi:MAG: translocation/assembly module TamB domain-containing protein [Hyphomonadaceae bacterium]|nr:translocation/assembly module TamB domain-containing protein [Hyphomonadaceae bacterium]
MNAPAAAPAPRNRRVLLMATVGVVVLAVGAAGFVIGPGGPMLAATLAEGRTVWRLGSLHLEGVGGAGLGDLRASRATLRDEAGVWAEARDLTLGWDPLRVLFGVVTIREAAAGSLHIYRRPVLSAPRPSGGAIDVDLSGLTVARLEIEEPVFGQAAVFTVGGGLAMRGGDLNRAALDVKRLDAAGDALTLDLARADAIRLNLTLESPEGGFFAAALETAAPVKVTATARGDDVAGEGALSAVIGDATLAQGDLTWTKAQWRLGADVDLAPAPVLAGLVETFGADIRIDGSGARGDDRTFTATLTAAQAGVEARGAMGDGLSLDGPLAIRARADRLEAFTPGVSAGAALFDGVMTREGDVTQFEGRLDGRGVTTADICTTSSGPVRVRVTRTLVDVDADLALSAVSGVDAVARLARAGQLTVRGRFDRATNRFDMRTARFVSPQGEVTAQGVLGADAPGLRGRWRIDRLDAVDPAVRGGGAGDWTLTGGFEDRPFVINLQGAARRFSTTLVPLDQLLGASPRVDTQFAIADGVVAVRRLLVTAPKLRLGAVGRLDDGVAALTFEGSAQGPVQVGTARFEGVADATGAIQGRLNNPALTAKARLSQLDVAGLVIDQPVVTVAFTPDGDGRFGRVALDGAVDGQPATASALLAADDDGLSLSNLRIDAAGFTAQGNAAFTRAGPSLDVSFAGPVERVAAPLQGRIAGVATVRPAAAGQAVLDAEARITQGRIGTLAFTRLDARAQGPLDDFALRASVRGATSGAPVSFDIAGRVARTGDATRASLTGQGAVADTSVTARGDLDLAGEDITARGAFQLGDGSATMDFASTGGRLSVRANLDNAPIAPIFALAGERATGRATGALSASGAGPLTAAIDMKITDALFARRARDPVSLDLRGAIDGGMMTLSAAASSRNGLTAAIDGRAPVTARAQPLRVALNGEGRATWRAKGPADALWGLVGSLDQSVTGQVDGEGDIRFAVGRLSGSGGLTLSQGRFADKQTGLDLRDVVARIRFDDEAARLEQFSARDARGGTVTATGAAQGLGDGRIDLITRDIQLLGRPDARAVASGPLSLQWRADGATLTGDLEVSQATLAPPRAAENIAELDVIEINRPVALIVQDEPSTVLPATALDVRIRAPGRVVLRGRGLDSEWALDMRVAGTAAAPLIFGEARLIRGRFTLAGRPFEAERGLIRFNGDPTEALIDLVAELSAPELTARVALSGPVNDPEITLSSTPSLPEDEILPQALFGRASEDLSALEAAQLAASLAELAGQASLNIAGAARDLVGLDRLDVREEAGVGLRVAGGKYLTRDVYLEVARNGIGEAETQVEWRVRPQLYLISAFEPSGDRRLSVRWRREY